jgi:transcriptional regulator with PAS, ATPase and Fis domain
MGASATRRVDIRLVAATNADLDDKVRKGEFRADLFYRLNIVEIRVAPLRERASEIVELVDHFFTTKGRSCPALHDEAVGILTRYSWPGNVRELENEIERILAFHRNPREITPSMLSERITRHGEDDSLDVSLLCDAPLPKAVGYLEESLLRKTLAETNWNKSRSARLLGLSRQGLLKKIKRYGIIEERTLPASGANGDETTDD